MKLPFFVVAILLIASWSEAADFSGPGTVTCPDADAVCTTLVTEGDCDGTACSLNLDPVLDDTADSVSVTLKCNCNKARNCDDSCTFESFEADENASSSSSEGATAKSSTSGSATLQASGILMTAFFALYVLSTLA